MLSQAKIKQIRALQRRKYRDEHDLFVVEGATQVLEALALGHKPEFIVRGTEYDNIPPMDVPLFSADSAEMKTISALATPPGLIAVFTKPKRTTVLGAPAVILQRIQDPGNVGTIIRSADWFGLPTVWLSSGTADAFNAKVVQAAMGSLWNVQLGSGEAPLSEAQFDTVGLVVEGGDGPQILRNLNPVFIVGNESSGLSEEELAACKYKLSLPGFGRAESLNAAMAFTAAAALWRQINSAESPL